LPKYLDGKKRGEWARRQIARYLVELTLEALSCGASLEESSAGQTNKTGGKKNKMTEPEVRLINPAGETL